MLHRPGEASEKNKQTKKTSMHAALSSFALSSSSFPFSPTSTENLGVLRSAPLRASACEVRNDSHVNIALRQQQPVPEKWGRAAGAPPLRPPSPPAAGSAPSARPTAGAPTGGGRRRTAPGGGAARPRPRRSRPWRRRCRGTASRTGFSTGAGGAAGERSTLPPCFFRHRV